MKKRGDNGDNTEKRFGEDIPAVKTYNQSLKLTVGELWSVCRFLFFVYLKIPWNKEIYEVKHSTRNKHKQEKEENFTLFNIICIRNNSQHGVMEILLMANNTLMSYFMEV